jgi:uncharacterized cupin superfamily protein
MPKNKMIVQELKDIPSRQSSSTLTPSSGIRVKILCGDHIPTESLLVGFMQWDPGKKSTRHYHPNCEEIQYILYGDGILRDCEDNEYPLRAGTFFYCPKGIEGTHQIDNSKSDTPLALIFGYPSNNRETIKRVEYDEST